MRLGAYLARLEDTIRSRTDIEVKHLFCRNLVAGAIFEADLQFHDQSRLVVSEVVEETRQGKIRQVDFSFHYQQADGTPIFRYDNSPHHPQVSTFPSHKHIGNEVVPAGPPDLTDVLREIDGIIYPRINL